MAPTILIVEDYTAVLEGMVQALRDAEFLVVATVNGAEALAYLTDGGPADAIVLDLMMPFMDGWQFRRAQQSDPWLAEIPVIVLSALEGRPVAGLSAAKTLKKPIDLKTLVETVRAVCAESPRPRRRRFSFRVP